ncbi:MAG: SusC/RagA family TonB-linked outer membrane protein [Prolixibacteraceae bacterium]|nr:SusC/RagA family TonB-linked outer membrane protein [Prolixibacteraceae bacterium]
MRKVLLLTVMCLALIGSALAQQKVTGNVTGDDGSGIPGVTVFEVGTSNGVLTDYDGNYSIQVKNSNAILRFTFVGMKMQEVAVSGKSAINVKLESENIGIDEVVVTALGIKREAIKLGYAMTEVKGADLKQANTINPVQALQGKSAGLSIGQSDGGLFGNSKIQLRGVSVMNSGNNQPIFVVDGVILENGISTASADWDASANDYGNILKNLNADDFESISVLKGAASTALYGSRGINGAIIIKTKDGKAAKGIGVTISQTVGFDNVYATPDFQYEFGPGALAGYVDYGDKDANGQYYRFSPGTQFYKNSKGIPTKIGHPWPYGFGPKFDGRDIEDYDGSIVKYEPSKNMMLDAYDTGYNTNTSVALSGGNDKGNFYLSDSYTYRTGNLPSNTFTRNALQFSGSYNLANWLKAEASVSFTISNPENPRFDLAENYITNLAWLNWYDPTKWKNQDVWQAPHGGVPSSAYGDKYANVPGNGTWFNYYMNDIQRTEQVTRPIVRLNAKVNEWLSLTAEGNMNYYTINSENKELGTGYANEGGFYRLTNSVDVSKTAKFTANMNKNWGEDFTTSLIVGGELWSQRVENTSVQTDGGLIVPGRFYLGNSKKTLVSSGGVSGTKQINSVYYLFNVGWKNQLYVDITGRNDWSSTLVYTDGSGNYSYFYPSVSASWIMNETFELPGWVTLSKLRASYAQVGNDTSPYAINTGYSVGSVETTSGNFIYTNNKSTTLVDPSIKPEKKNSFEVGLDLRVLNNRASIDAAYYNESIVNQIGSIPLPGESGFGSMMTNIGTMTNKGFEITLKGTPVKTKDFEWESTFNYWRNTTMISDLNDKVGAYKPLGGDIAYGNFRVGTVAYEDGEYGVIMSDTKPLLWNNANDAKDPRNGMKVLTWVDSRRGAYYTRSYKAEEVGKIQPDFEGSWNNGFSYKNLRLDVLLDARFGGHIASFMNKYGHAYGMLESSTWALDKEHGGIEWTTQYADSKGQTYQDGVIPDGVFAAGQKVTAPNGTQVDVGGLTYKEAMDKGYVEPTHASYFTYRNSSWSTGVINDNWFNEVKYIALRNISLSYTLPTTLAQKLKAKSMSVALNARNVAYLYNSLPNHLNPEGFRGTSSNDSFRERSLVPYTASYTMSVSVSF